MTDYSNDLILAYAAKYVQHDIGLYDIPFNLREAVLLEVSNMA